MLLSGDKLTHATLGSKVVHDMEYGVLLTQKLEKSR